MEELRADLRFIREYYKLKRTMKRHFEVTDHGDYKSLIARYDTLAKAAPKRQAQVYEALIIKQRQFSIISPCPLDKCNIKSYN